MRRKIYAKTVKILIVILGNWTSRIRRKSGRIREWGVRRFEPHHFPTAWSLLKPKMQKKSILARKSHGSCFLDIPYQTMEHSLRTGGIETEI